jgi:hypothetical protein
MAKHGQKSKSLFAQLTDSSELAANIEGFNIEFPVNLWDQMRSEGLIK